MTIEIRTYLHVTPDQSPLGTIQGLNALLEEGGHKPYENSNQGNQKPSVDVQTRYPAEGINHVLFRNHSYS